MTTAACQTVRNYVMEFMGALPGPDSSADEDVNVRADGVREFGRRWTVREESDGAGLTARFSDRDDVIEFGLLMRDAGQALNVLYATLVLDDDEVLLNVVSESDMDFNFDAKLNADQLGRLQETLQFYAQHLAA